MPDLRSRGSAFRGLMLVRSFVQTVVFGQACFRTLVPWEGQADSVLLTLQVERVGKSPLDLYMQAISERLLLEDLLGEASPALWA
jgi:hypothetical protein